MRINTKGKFKWAGPRKIRSENEKRREEAHGAEGKVNVVNEWGQLEKK